jgi:uncharacterized protein YciI
MILVNFNDRIGKGETQMPESSDSSKPKVFGKDVPKTLFLLRHRFQKDPKQFEEAYKGHRKFFDRNVDEGHFICGGPTVPWDGGMILVCAADRAEAEEIVSTDPLVGEGITVYEIQEWKTTIRRDDFDAILETLGAPAG